MKSKRLSDELIEDSELDKKIIKTFKPKGHLSEDIFEKIGDEYVLREKIRNRLIEVSNEFMDFVDIDFWVNNDDDDGLGGWSITDRR